MRFKPGLQTRTLYSAYLACCIEKDRRIADQAREVGAGMDIVLRTAMRKLKHAISGHLPTSLSRKPVSERVVCTAS